MSEFNTEIKQIELTLEDISNDLISSFNNIYAIGIPEDADKIVIWIPMGERYNLKFTYMSHDANEAGNSYPQLDNLDTRLNNLLNDYLDIDCDDLEELCALTDTLVAAWLKSALDKSKFHEVALHKVMAINNVCAYFDLSTLDEIDDDDMWH